MLAAAANVLCFPEALTDDVTNAGHGWAGMQSLWLTDWFSWANPPKQHMLETTDSCFPKEVSLCSLLLPETRSQRFQKKVQNWETADIVSEPGRRWLHLATLKLNYSSPFSLLCFTFLCPTLFHLSGNLGRGKLYTNCRFTTFADSKSWAATFVVQTFVNVAADQKIPDWWSLA